MNVMSSFRVILGVGKADLRTRTTGMRSFGFIRYISPYMFGIITFPSFVIMAFLVSIGEYGTFSQIFTWFSGREIAVIAASGTLSISLSVPLSRSVRFGNASEAELVLGAPITPVEYMLGKLVGNMADSILTGLMIGGGALGFLLARTSFSIALMNAFIVFCIASFSSLTITWVGLLQIPKAWSKIAGSEAMDQFSGGKRVFRETFTSLGLLGIPTIIAIVFPTELSEIIFSFLPMGWIGYVMYYFTALKLPPLPLPLAAALATGFLALCWYIGVRYAPRRFRLSAAEEEQISVSYPTPPRFARLVAYFFKGRFKTVLRLMTTENLRRGAMFQMVGIILAVAMMQFFFTFFLDFGEGGFGFGATTIIGNFISVLIFMVTFEIYSALSGTREALWLIKGAPGGVRLVLWAKSIQVSLTIMPFAFILGAFLSWLTNLSLILVYITLSIGGVFLGVGIATFSFGLRPVSDLGEMTANPLNIFIIMFIQIPVLIILFIFLFAINSAIESNPIFIIVIMPLFLIASLVIAIVGILLGEWRLEAFEGGK
ncbi:MAG: hypothetical protein ACFFDI_06765 [Promethearchaeota archaeon]